MIIIFIMMLACTSKDIESQSYAEKNGWVEIKPPRPDIQCWRVRGGPQVACAESLTSTHGASNGNN